MLIGVWNSIPPNYPNHLPAYFAALTRKTAMQRYESAHRLKRGGTHFSMALDELAEILSSPDCVERQIEQRELTVALSQWLRTLPQEHRRIFMQRYFYSETIQSVAQTHQMSADAVKMLLMRLRSKLKDYLRKEGLL
jgi:RNA polymerase sigma-70 factor (ECF subfamily)